MSVWLAALILVIMAGALEGERRAWNRRRPASIEDIGASLATARAKQRQLPRHAQATCDSVDDAPATRPPWPVSPRAGSRSGKQEVPSTQESTAATDDATSER